MLGLAASMTKDCAWCQRGKVTHSWQCLVHRMRFDFSVRQCKIIHSETHGNASQTRLTSLNHCASTQCDCTALQHVSQRTLLASHPPRSCFHVDITLRENAYLRRIPNAMQCHALPVMIILKFAVHRCQKIRLTIASRYECCDTATCQQHARAVAHEG